MQRIHTQAAGRRQVGLRVRLGIDHIVTRHHGLEQVEQPGCAKMMSGMGIARRGCDSRRNAPFAQFADEFAGAALHRHAGMAALAHDNAAAFVEQGIGKGHAIGLDQQPVGVLVAASDHGHMHGVSHFEAQLGADFEDDGPEHAFGVEDGAVHVENDGLERREAQDVALRFHLARYRAI
jgi:hypothetical protein